MRKELKKFAAFAAALAVFSGNFGNMTIVNEISTVSAENTISNGQGPTLTAVILDKKEYKPGDTFTVQIKVTDNEDGYSALRSNIAMNPSVFEMVEWNPGDPKEKNYSKTPQKSNTTMYEEPDDDGNIISLNQLYFDSAADNFTGSNVFSTVTFKIKESAPAGKYSINIEPDEASGAQGNRVIKEDSDRTILVLDTKYIGAEFEIVASSETTDTSDKLNGDVNGDGTVNAMDVLILMNCILGSQKASEYPNADVNEDGTVTIMDLVRLKNMIIENNN